MITFKQKRIYANKFLFKVYRASDKKIVNKLHRQYDAICKDEIDMEWKRDLKKGDIVCINESKTRRNINGFIILRRFRKNRLLISVVCSRKRGLGSASIKLCERIGRKLKFIMIEVHALFSSRKFYEKHGFIKSSNPCARRVIIKPRKTYDKLYRYTKCLR